MTCDIDYRYRRALEPDGLTTFENALRALNEAVEDARLAALDPAVCPAIKLLTRHLGRVSHGEPLCHTALDDELRHQCIERIAELKRAPAIVALVRRGLDYRPQELRHYRRAGSRTLRAIAFRLGYTTPQESLAGDHTLEAKQLYLRISPERYGEPGVAWRNPHWKPPGATMRKASITALRDIPALAARIARELKLPSPAQPGLI